MADSFLKTRQVADALGISVSTLKRWVNEGHLAASRTVGKHRLISLAEALRFARERNLGAPAMERLAASGLEVASGVDDRTRDALTAALREGRRGDARRLIRSAYASLGGAAALADEVLRPVMEAIGHGWSVGLWDVYQEHQASQIVSAALTDLIAEAARADEAPAPVALGASPEGDHYTLAALSGELALREIGWEVKNLGPDLPLRSLARAVEAYRPRLVFLAVSHLADPVGFVEEYNHFARTADVGGAAVLLGGRGLPRDIRPRLDGAAFGDRMADLVEFGLRHLPTALPSRNNGPRTTDRRGPETSSTHN